MAQYFIKSPDQASKVYGLDGNTIPRGRNLFYVHFNVSGTTSSTWNKTLGFVVKSVDRPSVRPQIEEINQYNKRRQVTTGLKYEPVRVTLYDTADNMAMRMWDDYSRYYFGDFGQTSSMYASDVTLPVMFDSGSGFGFVPQTAGGATSGDSQTFFDSIDVYTVFGGYFTKFSLINPKITDFAPDDLEYAQADLSSITMTMAYEAVLYANNNNPQPISTNSMLSTVFANQFAGDTFAVPGTLPRTLGFSPGTLNLDALAQTDPRVAATVSAADLNPTTTSLGGGALAAFGNYSFGSTSTGLNTSGDSSYSGLSNPALATSLNLPTQSGDISAVINPPPQPGVPGALFDSATGAMSSSSDSSFAQDYVSSNLTPGVAAAALATGTSAQDQVTNTTDGVTLSSTSYAVVNAQRSTTSQLGVNSDSQPVYNVPYNQLSSYDNLYSASDPATLQVTPIPYTQAFGGSSSDDGDD